MSLGANLCRRDCAGGGRAVGWELLLDRGPRPDPAGLVGAFAVEEVAAALVIEVLLSKEGALVGVGWRWSAVGGGGWAALTVQPGGSGPFPSSCTSSGIIPFGSPSAAGSLLPLAFSRICCSSGQRSPGGVWVMK